MSALLIAVFSYSVADASYSLLSAFLYWKYKLDGIFELVIDDEQGIPLA